MGLYKLVFVNRNSFQNLKTKFSKAEKNEEFLERVFYPLNSLSLSSSPQQLKVKQSEIPGVLYLHLESIKLYKLKKLVNFDIQKYHVKREKHLHLKPGHDLYEHG